MGLPADIERWASPLNEPGLAEDVATSIWRAIDLHHRGEGEQAVAVWKRIQLPPETEVWSLVALADTYLASGELAQAGEVLAVAKERAAENAVVHYYLGLLRLGQSQFAEEWYDAVMPGRTRLAAWTSPDVAPNTRSMYQLAAIQEFEAAIDGAPDVWFDQPLVPAQTPTSAMFEPTVRDLLLALRSENFVAKSHNALGCLFLDRGSLELAEEHMDEAAAGGVAVLYGYSDLAEEYVRAGQRWDAIRAYLKATQQEADKVTPLVKAWKNLLN
jgi:tetratricopeptide (TPR) repeat protein